ncbi:MAG: universal stress protein [Candidatus Dadabacteria bacterium]|nr:MAG: universal stress protein [Candidatus Dadabacteria bacterium]
MDKILLTTDLSQESKEAISIAAELARKFGASVEILTVLEDPAQAAMAYALEFPVFPDVEIQKQVVEKIRKELDKIVSEEFEGIAASAHVVEAKGPVHAEIRDYAKNNSVDLIVIASHGHSGIKSLLMGSVAERVAKSADCPVLIVPVKSRE